jgi:hypothetical protein
MNIVKGILLGGAVYFVGLLAFVLSGGFARFVGIPSGAQYTIQPSVLLLLSFLNIRFLMCLVASLLLGIAFFTFRKQA